jgi:hypothetical protein
MTAHERSTATAPRHLLLWLGATVAVMALASIAVYRLAWPATNTESPPAKAIELPRVEASGPPWLRDRTADSGVNFTYRNGEEADQYTILESLGGGVALFDFDGDGLLDVFLTGGGFFDGAAKDQINGLPCKLYKNLGGWKFRDVTREVGLEVPWWYTHGVAVADYDCDGWPDLLVTGYGKLALFHNEPDGSGGRRFVDVSERVGLRDESWNTGAGWADLDGDGFPDLYVCRYTDWSFANHPACPGLQPGVPREVCPPHRFKPLMHALFHNEQGKSFRNVSIEQGFKAAGYGLGVVLADLNGDGRPDIFVSNDLAPNMLFMNRGGKLAEQAGLAGVALNDTGIATASMGVDTADYDGSGRPSLFVTNFQRELHSLYWNLGNELFLYQSEAAGLAALGRVYVGWGTSFVDIDNDGWEDLLIVNGHLYRKPAGSPVRQRPFLLHNEESHGRRTFRDIGTRGSAIFQTPALARGLAVGDLDNDGWPDLVISNVNSPAVLVQNVAAASSPAGWLGVRLVGRGNRDVVGSTVVVESAGRKLTRFAKGGGSYLSANDTRILFGMSGARAERISVRWSWGETQTWENLESNRYWELHEGEDKARLLRGTR